MSKFGAVRVGWPGFEQKVRFSRLTVLSGLSKGSVESFTGRQWHGQPKTGKEMWYPMPQSLAGPSRARSSHFLAGIGMVGSKREKDVVSWAGQE